MNCEWCRKESVTYFSPLVFQIGKLFNSLAARGECLSKQDRRHDRDAQKVSSGCVTAGPGYGPGRNLPPMCMHQNCAQEENLTEPREGTCPYSNVAFPSCYQRYLNLLIHKARLWYIAW